MKYMVNHIIIKPYQTENIEKRRMRGALLVSSKRRAVAYRWAEMSVEQQRVQAAEDLQ